MTGTRNEGTGPTFLEIEYQPTSLRVKNLKKQRSINLLNLDQFSSYPDARKENSY